MTVGNCCFIFDLHLFSRRPHSEWCMGQIAQAADVVQIIVLGGDIFDFKWNTLWSVGNTVRAAIEWLDELLTTYLDSDFHYILGNHACASSFVERLSELAETKANLSRHRYLLRSGDSIFLHGDWPMAEWISRQWRNIANHGATESERAAWPTCCTT